MTKKPVSAFRKLPPHLRKFVDLIVDGKTGADAVRAMRPKLLLPKDLAWRWRQREDVKAAIEERAQEMSSESAVQRQLVLRELRRIAFLDPMDLFADDGNLKQLHEIPPEARAAIAGIEIEALFEGRGEERAQSGFLKKVKLAGKIDALKLLGQHERLYAERVEHTGKDGEPLPAPDPEEVARRVAFLLASAMQQR